jgi:hypothetical protein
MPIRLTGKNLSSDETTAVAQVQQELERPTAVRIYAQVAKNARLELGYTARSLAISGFAVGGGVRVSAKKAGLACAVRLRSWCESAPEDQA